MSDIETTEAPGSIKVTDSRAAARPLAERQTGAVDTSPPAVIAKMLASGVALTDMKAMLELQERWEAKEAKKAYAVAMARFKANPPVIDKDKTVQYGEGSNRVTYDHATIGNVVGKIVALLAHEGLSHRWAVEQADQITVTCTVTHELGHSESVTMKAGRDDSGKKNAIQQIASTVTYLQRYTLLAATGLATNDQPDDDGGGADGAAERTVMTDEHQKVLTDLCTAIGPTILANVLREYKAATLEQVADSEFETIVTILKNMKAKRDKTAPAAGAAK